MNGRPLKKIYLPIQEERRLVHLWIKEEDVRARNKIVESHLWMADGMAYQYRYYGYAQDDLFGAGCEGLMIAVDKFDPTKKVRFRTYASYWVRAKIIEYILKNWTAGKTCVGTGRTGIFFKARRVRGRLLAQHGVATREMIAAEVPGVTDAFLQQIDGTDGSLHSENERGVAWIEEFASTDPSPEDVVLALDGQEWASERARGLLARLDPRERLVIRERFMAEEPLTLAKIGRGLGISRERTRQIEMRAIDKLRRTDGKERAAMEALKTTRRIIEIEGELEKMQPLQEEYTDLIRRRLREIERQLERHDALVAEKDELMNRLRLLTGGEMPRKPYTRREPLPTVRKRREAGPRPLTPKQSELLEHLRSACKNLSLWVPIELIYGWYPDTRRHVIGGLLGQLKRRGLVENNQAGEWRVIEKEKP